MAMVGSTWAGSSRDAVADGRSGPMPPGSKVTCSSEQNHTVAPSMVGLPWSMPSALRPASHTAHFGATDMTVASTLRAWRKRQAELGVGGVHQRVGAGLQLGAQRVCRS